MNLVVLPILTMYITHVSIYRQKLSKLHIRQAVNIRCTKKNYPSVRYGPSTLYTGTFLVGEKSHDGIVDLDIYKYYKKGTFVHTIIFDFKRINHKTRRKYT